MDLMTKARAYGSERIEFVKSAKTKEDWKKWQDSKNKFPFEWGSCWNKTIEYRVSDYEAEIGFFIDVLGFDCNSISDSYAMFMSPAKEFFFSVRKPKEGESSTPADAISIEFMIKNMKKTADSLKSRGVQFTLEPQQEEPGSPMYISRFKTPNGINIQLWSMEEIEN
jgi:predicted enzyme related to lactoylglutathione lyase